MSIIRSGSFPESVMLRHLKRLAHRQAARKQFGQRVIGIAMMHESPTGFFPEMTVLERGIDEDFASLGMAALVDSNAGARKTVVMVNTLYDRSDLGQCRLNTKKTI